MANTRSAEKQQRQAEKAKTRNRAGISRLRTQLKRTKQTLEEGTENPQPVLATAYSEIDTARKKSFIKENTANRYKSRLAGLAKRSATSK